MTSTIRRTASLWHKIGAIFSLLLLLSQLVLSLDNTKITHAGDYLTSAVSVYYGSTDYPAGTPVTAPLVPPSSAVTLFLDIRNPTATLNSLDNFLLTSDLSAFTGTPTCSVISGSYSDDHSLLDFDLNGTACSINGSNEFGGVGFPTSIPADGGVFIRITGLSVGSDNILFYMNMSGDFSGTPYGPAVDHGYITVGNSAIIGYVFHDLDNTGVADNLDYQYIGVTVGLKMRTGPVASTTSTDAHGYYIFTDLDFPVMSTGNNYFVTVTPFSASDSLTTYNNGQNVVSLALGKTLLSDVGYYSLPSNSLGNFVWDDTDADGIQDLGENGISGIGLNLYQVHAEGDIFLGSDTSDMNGNYTFYWTPSLNCLGQAFNFGDSDADTEVIKRCTVAAGGDYYITFRTDAFCVADNSYIRLTGADGSILYAAGCGSRAPDLAHTLENETTYSIGPISESANGVATLSAIDGYGDATVFDVTWIYTGAITTQNYVVFSSVPTGYVPTVSNQGSSTEDSDIDTNSGTQTYTITMSQGSSDLTHDLGFTTNSGSSDANIIVSKIAEDETPISETNLTYTITAYNQGPATASGVTVVDVLPTELTWVSDDSSGDYDSLTGIWSIGTLAAEETRILNITVYVTGTDPITNTATGSTITSESDSSDNVSTIIVYPHSATTGSISGLAWIDADSDGIRDGVETLQTNIRVDLHDTATEMPIATQYTDADGEYIFSGLSAGDYAIKFIVEDGFDITDMDVGSDDTIDSDANQTTGYTTTISLAAGEDIMHVDVGFVEDSEVTGNLLLHIFTDANGNGEQDSSEIDGASNTTIRVTHGSDEIDIAATGHMTISLPASSESYTITVIPPTGRSVTGGSNPIYNVYISEGEETDIGSRGIHRTSSSSGGGGSSRVIWGNIGSGNSSSNSGWTSSNDSSSRSTTHSRTTTRNTNTPSTALADSVTCLHLNNLEPLNFIDSDEINDGLVHVNFLTSILNAQLNDRIVKGYQNGYFGPHTYLTRFELTKIALESNCITSSHRLVPNSSFTDVPNDNSDMSLIIGTAKQLGIIQGIDDKFYPNNPVSFGEMVKILLGSNIAVKNILPTLTFDSNLEGITDERFMIFAQFANQINMTDLENNSFPQNKWVQRNEMAKALAVYIRYLKSFATN